MTVAANVVAGRYELGPVLGRGGMGDVRAAQDLRLGRAVAVKLLPPDLAGDASARRRFEDEARAAARIVHPHVVAVYDSGEHEGTPFLVMECLPGRTLADEIAAGRLAPARVRQLALEVLGGLAAAHRAGVLHRDLKPGNILLTADGHAKVGDFGIAKMAEGLDHTATGLVVGTPSYLAPERLAGLSASERSDLFAVGVLVHEALTGTKPPRAPGAGDAPLDGTGTVPPPDDAGLLHAARRAMAEDPAARFASAADMAAAILAGPAPEAAPGAVGAPTPTTRVVVDRSATDARVEAPTRLDAGQPTVTGTAPGGRSARGGGARPGRRRSTAGRRLALAVVAALLVLVAVAGALLAADRGTDDGAEARPPGSPELAEDLERRVRTLEEAVQP